MDALIGKLQDALQELQLLSAASLGERENPYQVLREFGKSVTDLADSYREDNRISQEAGGHDAGEANSQLRLLEVEVSSLRRRLTASQRNHEDCGQQIEAANAEVETLMENNRSILREHQNCPSLRQMDELQLEVHDYSTQLDEVNTENARLKRELESLRILPRGAPAPRDSGHSSGFNLHSSALSSMRQPAMQGTRGSGFQQRYPDLMDVEDDLPEPRRIGFEQQAAPRQIGIEQQVAGPSHSTQPANQGQAPLPVNPTAPLPYDFLVSGDTRTGPRLTQGPAEVITMIQAQVPAWNARQPRWSWQSASKKLQCINYRVRGLGKTGGRHEDPADPKTACSHCVSRQLPCIMALPNLRPTVLPLPASERRAGATPADRAYYVKDPAPIPVYK
jgi:hypothetical protein